MHLIAEEVVGRMLTYKSSRGAPLQVVDNSILAMFVFLALSTVRGMLSAFIDGSVRW